MMSASSKLSELKAAAYEKADKNGGKKDKSKNRKRPPKPFKEMTSEEVKQYYGDR